MNLSHVIASLDARHGGPSKSTRSLAQAQAEQGARVDLFAGSDTPSRETRGQLTTTLLARGWLDRLGVLPGLATHLRRAEPDRRARARTLAALTRSGPRRGPNLRARCRWWFRPGA
jgi:hypothetical protein